MDLTQLQVQFHTCQVDDSWAPDPIGYFIIHATRRGLRAEHYTPSDYPTTVFSCALDVPLARHAETLRKAILGAFPDIETGHYGYLCQELARAQCSLEFEFDYTQD